MSFKTVSRFAGRTLRRAAGVALAGMIVVSGTGIAQAATLADVFDAKQYADDYADLKNTFGYDEKALFQHYLTYGIAEKREVSGLLDVVKYREAYADLDAAFGDNWDAYVNHYLTYGVYEHRDNFTDFDALDYMERYGDLKAVFGDDALALYNHYQTFGKTEQRESRSEKVVVAEREAAKAAAQQASKAPSSSGNSGSSGQSGAHTETFYYDDGSYSVWEYDNNGKQITTKFYDADGNLTERDEYEYNSDGKVYKQTVYNADGSIVRWYENEYDSAGNHKSIFYNSDGSKGSEHEFDSADNCIKTIVYNAVGSISSWYEYEYDSDGNRVKTTVYNADGSIDYWFENIYDSDGTYSTKIYDGDDSSNEIQLAVPTGLRWGDNWTAEWNSYDGGLPERFSSQGFVYEIETYKDGEHYSPASFSFWSGDGIWLQSFRIADKIQDSGTYQYRLRIYVLTDKYDILYGEWSEWGEKKIYEKPQQQLGTVVGQWSEKEKGVFLIPLLDGVYYDVQVYFTPQGSDRNNDYIGGYTGGYAADSEYSGDSGKFARVDYNDLISRYGAGKYCVAIRLLSEDIETVANGEWGDYSEYLEIADM